jgi:hypothetical protein
MHDVLRKDLLTLRHTGLSFYLEVHTKSEYRGKVTQAITSFNSGNGNSVMKVSTSDYLVVCCQPDVEGEKPKTIYLSYHNIFTFINLIDKVAEWFTCEKFDDLFLDNGDNLGLAVNADKRVDFKLRGLNKIEAKSSMRAFPEIVSFDNQDIPGIALLVGEKNYCAYLYDEQVLALKHFLNNFNLSTESAAIIQTSIAFGNSASTSSNNGSRTSSSYVSKRSKN